MIKKKYINFSIILCLSFGALFSIFSIIFYYGDWVRALLVFFWGFFVGALAIPEFEKKAVKKPILFQSIIGSIGGCFAALAFTNNLDRKSVV